MANLKVTIDVRDDQTMSVYHVGRSGIITFKNAHASDQLFVRPKAGFSNVFCEPDGTTPIAEIVVPANSTSSPAKVCTAFTGQELLYEAQIGTAVAEDPIVIIESYSPIVIIETLVPILGAALLGAVAGYVTRGYVERRKVVRT